jgi:hypothetical protein
MRLALHENKRDHHFADLLQAAMVGEKVIYYQRVDIF